MWIRYLRDVPSDWVNDVWWLAPPGGDCADGKSFPQPVLWDARIVGSSMLAKRKAEASVEGGILDFERL